jgi:hypothetical protein
MSRCGGGWARPSRGVAPRRGAHGSIRTISRGWTIASAAAILLLICAPAESGPTPTLTAPYLTGVVHSFTHQSSIGCANLSVAKSKFNLTSGVGGFSARAGAATCPKGSGGASTSSYALAEGSSEVGFPISPPASGIAPSSIRVNATFHLTASANSTVVWKCPAAHRNRSTGAGSSNCIASSLEVLNISVVLQDLTRFTRVPSSNPFSGFNAYSSTYSDDFCFSYGCYWSNYSYAYSSGLLGGNFSWWINTTLNSADKYNVVVTVGATVGVALQGFPRSHIDAALNFGTKGNDWNLTSISVR